MSNQNDKPSAGYYLLNVFVWVLVASGMYLMIFDENGPIPTLLLLASVAGIVLVVAYGHVFRFLYGVAVVLGMTAMMVFSVIVHLPHTVVKTFDRLRTTLVRT